MNPLDQLADIMPPDAVSIWPLAWGYWLLLVIVIALIGLCIFGILKYRNERRAKREALKSLANVDTANEYYAHKIQVLMKSLCAHYLPLLSSSQMHGEEWKSLVLSIYRGKDSSNFSQVIDELYLALYFPKITSGTNFIHQNKKIQSTIDEWIKSSFPCKNQGSNLSSYQQIDDSAAREVNNV